jgi:hypothetical protein
LGEFGQEETFGTGGRVHQPLHLSPGLGYNALGRWAFTQGGVSFRGLHG